MDSNQLPRGVMVFLDESMAKDLVALLKQNQISQDLKDFTLALDLWTQLPPLEDVLRDLPLPNLLHVAASSDTPEHNPLAQKPTLTLVKNP